MVHNGLSLDAVADFGASRPYRRDQYSIPEESGIDARLNVQLTSSPAIKTNACYRLGFLSFALYLILFVVRVVNSVSKLFKNC